MNNTPTKNPTQDASAKKAGVQNLKNSIHTIDSLAQEGFGQISAMASLMLASIEGGLTPVKIDNLHRALRNVRSMADIMQEHIHSEAEAQDCQCPAEFRSPRMQMLKRSAS